MMVKSTRNTIAELASQQLEQGSLVTRMTKISLPKDSKDSDPSAYYNGQLLAVEGFSREKGIAPKRHFCVLLNTPKNVNSPSVLTHTVVELVFNDLDENEIPEDRKLTKWTPLEGIQGYAFILEAEQRTPKVPLVATPSLDLTSPKPEMNPHEVKVLGNKHGGIVINVDGSTHIIAGDGTEVKMGEDLELGAKEIKATSGQGDNWLYIWNPMANGKMMPLPELLPMFVSIRILPNIPGIINMYKKVDYFKKMFDGIQELTNTYFKKG